MIIIFIIVSSSGSSSSGSISGSIIIPVSLHVITPPVGADPTNRSNEQILQFMKNLYLFWHNTNAADN